MPIKRDDQLKVTVQEYAFKGFDQLIDKVDSYKFNQLDFSADNPSLVDSRTLREERAHAQKNMFQINDEVKKYRGISNQEEEDFERQVSLEVERRLVKLAEEVKEQAYSEGFNHGKDLAYQEAKENFEARLNQFSQLFVEIQQQSKDIIEQNKEDVYRLVKNLTKWVTLKEISDDGYLPKLLEKLILEMNEKNNLIIKVDEAHLDVMPDAIKLVEDKIGQLVNVRLEIDRSLKHKGIILESINGIIDGSLEAQFANIDKIFNTVGINND